MPLRDKKAAIDIPSVDACVCYKCSASSVSKIMRSEDRPLLQSIGGVSGAAASVGRLSIASSMLSINDQESTL